MPTNMIVRRDAHEHVLPSYNTPVLLAPRRGAREPSGDSVLELELQPIRAGLDRCGKRARARRPVLQGKMVLGRRVFMRIERALRLIDFGDDDGIVAWQCAGRLIVGAEVRRQRELAAAVG